MRSLEFFCTTFFFLIQSSGLLIFAERNNSFIQCEKVLLTKTKSTQTRRSVEHCTPHADGAWQNELGWSQ